MDLRKIISNYEGFRVGFGYYKWQDKISELKGIPLMVQNGIL
jgi:hypothetical protein